MKSDKNIVIGRLLAKTLARAWRPAPPPLDLSDDELAQITPRLLGTGGGALAWWRVRSSALADSPSARQLREAYRFHALRSALHRRWIVQAVASLTAAGIEPLLAKGWAVGRLYAEPGLRPAGDIDLWVRPEEHAEALTALFAPGVPKLPVDLHTLGARFAGDGRSADDLFGRSNQVTLGGTTLRVMGPEDHLRHVCLHLLKHDAWRPLWLCDVGALVESLPPGFDWEYFLSGDKKKTEWVVCVLALAQRLLGAKIDSPMIDIPNLGAPTLADSDHPTSMGVGGPRMGMVPGHAGLLP